MRSSLPKHPELIHEVSDTLFGYASNDAKIKIELTEDTGFPSRDHYDFLVDNVVFK